MWLKKVLCKICLEEKKGQNHQFKKIYRKNWWEKYWKDKKEWDKNLIHIRELHNFQSNILKYWVCGVFLYVFQFFHFYTM